MHGTCKYVMDMQNTLHWSYMNTLSLVVRIWICGDSAECVQVMDVKTKTHAYAKFNCASNLQMYIVSSDRPFISAASFFLHLSLNPYILTCLRREG